MMRPPRSNGATSTPAIARSRQRHMWLVAAAALAVSGVLASIFAAIAVGRGDHDKALRSFQHSSANVASTLQLAIEHESDVVSDAGGLLADPELSQREFLDWASSARVLDRYPEMAGIGVLSMVDATALPAFARRGEAGPAGLLGPDGAFAVVPPGVRPFYCFTSAVIARPSLAKNLAGLDYCAEPAWSAGLLAARDSGNGAYTPYPSEGRTWLVIQTPIYRGGGVPATVAARRSAFAGWVGTQLDPTVVLQRAAQGQPVSLVSMRYHVGSTEVAFSSGVAAAGAQSVATDLHNGWSVHTSALIDEGGITSSRALELLMAGIAVSVLLGLLTFVLGTGRERVRRQLVQRTSQLHHQALHDALTGLPNRALVTDRIEQMLVRNRRHDRTGAVLFLDLDDFKNINDNLGHGAGDRLLIAVAARLSSTLRGEDTIGRMGGDEFVVLIDSSDDEVDPGLVAERLIDVMRQPFKLDDVTTPLIVNVSIGLASGDRVNAEELLRDADIALYLAKGAGKNRCEIFDAHVQTAMSRRTDLEFDLRAALAGDQYRLVYQPIYDLRDLAVVGVEALLRWDHPVRGVISPDEFIPILEQTGQIREVGRWVLREACRQMAGWHAGGAVLDLSVNVSGRQLDGDDIVADIRDALHDSGLDAASLIIELTETALMCDVALTAQRLQAVKAMGVRIAVDDFGTGYSSLAYLRQFPVDSLKIDRMFTSAISSSPESRALVGTLVQLGKDLGLSTLAEGVETTDELDLLRGAKVNQAQGFLMARPLDPATLETQILTPMKPVVPIVDHP